MQNAQEDAMRRKLRQKEHRRQTALKHPKACQLCKKGKFKCDGQRPCARCVQRGTGDDCAAQKFSQGLGGLGHAAALEAAFPPAQALYQLAGAFSSPSGVNLSFQPPPLHASVGLPQNARVAEKKPRTNPVKVQMRVCIQCSRSKVRCDGDRPCRKCLLRGQGDACSDRQLNQDDSQARTSQGASKAPSAGAAGVAQDVGGGAAGKPNIWGHLAAGDGVRPSGMRVEMAGVDASSDARSTPLRGEGSSVARASTSEGSFSLPPSGLDSFPRCASASGAGLAQTDGQE